MRHYSHGPAKANVGVPRACFRWQTSCFGPTHRGSLTYVALDEVRAASITTMMASRMCGGSIGHARTTIAGMTEPVTEGQSLFWAHSPDAPDNSGSFSNSFPSYDLGGFVSSFNSRRLHFDSLRSLMAGHFGGRSERSGFARSCA